MAGKGIQVSLYVKGEDGPRVQRLTAKIGDAVKGKTRFTTSANEIMSSALVAGLQVLADEYKVSDDGAADDGAADDGAADVKGKGKGKK
jgi:hypothetical protein